MFIVIEGLDGSGKTTQAQRMAEYLAAYGKVLHTRQPSDSTIGGIARDAVRGRIPLEFTTMALLFAADRAEHMAKEILPALQQGIFVICDRFVYSNIAYQGTEISIENIAAYNRAAFAQPPDLTVFIDTSPEECTRRIIRTRGSMDMFDGVEYATRIRRQYLAAFELFGAAMPVEVVDGNGTADKVWDAVRGCIDANRAARASG